MLQVWLSPYQVAHGVAVAEHVAAKLPRFRAAPMPPPAAAVAAEVGLLSMCHILDTIVWLETTCCMDSTLCRCIMSAVAF